MYKTTIYGYQPSDRNIVIVTDGDNLIGLNYWQGLNEMSIADSFMIPDLMMTGFVVSEIEDDVETHQLSYANPNSEMLELIDDAIWKWFDRSNKKKFRVFRYTNIVREKEIYALNEEEAEMIAQEEDWKENEEILEDSIVVSDEKNTKSSENQDKTFKLSKEKKQLLIRAVDTLLKEFSKVISLDDEFLYEEFDLNVLKALLSYDVAITLTNGQIDSFTANHGVDFPTYYNPK